MTPGRMRPSFAASATFAACLAMGAVLLGCGARDDIGGGGVLGSGGAQPACATLDQSCSPGDCCPGLSCLEGQCALDDCGAAGSSCENDADCCDGSCAEGVCEAVCAPDGAPCQTDAGCCGGLCGASGVCTGGPGCEHDECTLGAPLEPSCTPCTASVCEVDESCCENLWHDGCVELATDLCLITCQSCAPAGATCDVPEDCCNLNCQNGICDSSPCVPDGAPCDDATNCCAGVCGANGLCGVQAECSHGLCETGNPLAPECAPCAAEICMTDPFCCERFWDELCVEEVGTICNLPCTSCLPAGAACGVGDTCCGAPCENGVCGGAPCLPDGFACVDPAECCTGVCEGGTCGSDPCIPDGANCADDASCCSMVCGADGFCGVDPGCEHDVCDEGGALNVACDDCTTAICEVDPFCCTQAWDALCVEEVGTICGQPCENNCSPDGAMCSDPDDCCSGTCNGGICGAPPPVCPSDGSPCGDCVANNCCDQLVSCFNSSGCLQDVQCFVECVAGGTGPIQCGFTCLSDPTSYQMVFCLAGQCGATCAGGLPF